MNLYSRTLAKQANGENVATYAEYVTEIPCSYKGISDNEQVEMKQRVGVGVAEFRIRYPHSFSVDQTMQILFESNTYQILGADEDEFGRKVEMIIRAKRKDNT
ncbi:MAG: head-tail adaptor protein [Bacteroidia bacterium]